MTIQQQSARLSEVVNELVPIHLKKEVEELLKKGGFCATHNCTQNRHGDWVAMTTNGIELVANIWHLSIDVPTGTSTELVTTCSFASGTRKMVFENKVRTRIPLREDSDIF